MKALLVTIFLMSSNAWAKEKVQSFHLTVSFGDKISTFKVDKATPEEVLVNGQTKKTSLKNAEYISKLASAALKEKSNDQKLCTRSYMLLEMPSAKDKTLAIVGCINSKTPAAKKLTELANALVLI